jgi:hypothetical protein
MKPGNDLPLPGFDYHELVEISTLSVRPPHRRRSELFPRYQPARSYKISPGFCALFWGLLARSPA